MNLIATIIDVEPQQTITSRSVSVHEPSLDSSSFNSINRLWLGSQVESTELACFGFQFSRFLK